MEIDVEREAARPRRPCPPRPGSPACPPIPPRPRRPDRRSRPSVISAGGIALLRGEPQHQARVHRPGAGRHHEPLERREAHRRVDRPPAEHRGERRPGAQVAGHDPQVRVAGAPEQLRHAPRRVCVRQPVEPVPADRPSLPPLAGDRVGRRGGRDRRVERGVEARHRGHAGQRLGDRRDPRERPRLVERGERRQRPRARRRPPARARPAP